MKDYLRSKYFVKSFFALIVFAQASLLAQPAIQWDKTIGGPVDSYLFSSQLTADGGYILGGYGRFGTSYNKTDPGVGKVDFWIVKLAADGKKEWDHAYGGPADDLLVSVQQTPDGGYILGGMSNSDAGGDKSENNNSGSNEGYRQNDYWVV